MSTLIILVLIVMSVQLIRGGGTKKGHGKKGRSKGGRR